MLYYTMLNTILYYTARSLRSVARAFLLGDRPGPGIATPQSLARNSLGIGIQSYISKGIR